MMDATTGVGQLDHFVTPCESACERGTVSDKVSASSHARQPTKRSPIGPSISIGK